jgi:hypothetical protein
MGRLVAAMTGRPTGIRGVCRAEIVALEARAKARQGRCKQPERGFLGAGNYFERQRARLRQDKSFFDDRQPPQFVERKRDWGRELELTEVSHARSRARAQDRVVT